MVYLSLSIMIYKKIWTQKDKLEYDQITQKDF